MRIVDSLEQGSETWHTWRQAGLGASDARAVACVDPWTTAYQLWQRKLNLAEPEAFNPAMMRGVQLEPKAREEFEWEHGSKFKPACVIHDEYDFIRASLDGLSPDHKEILEIKCPGEKNHAEAVAGNIPEYYRVQMVHQLLVVDTAEVNHYYSWHPEQGGVLITMHRDDKKIAKLLKLELDFWKLVCDQTPPEMTAKDYTARADKDWIKAAEDWLRVKKVADMAAASLKEHRARLVELAHGRSSLGAGVRAQIGPRKGEIDHDAVLNDRDAIIHELMDILGEPTFLDARTDQLDLEKHRKAGGIVATITAIKE